VDIFFIFAGIVLLAIGLSQGWLKGTGQTSLYRARSLMTDNEAEFFGRLVAALPDYYIFPQVAMSALIEAAASNKKAAHSDRLRIAQQRVDYVVCDMNCKVVAVVELDDRTHSVSKDQVRDARLLQGGIRTIRFQSKNKPSVGTLRAAIVPNSAMPLKSHHSS
jgi:hypothetical protein